MREMEHRAYIRETSIRKVLADVWRSSCAACRWEGPARYDKARAEQDCREHEAATRRR